MQKLLESIDQLRFAARGKPLAPKSFEIVLEPREIAHVLARHERLHGEGKRLGTSRFETPEVFEVRVDASGCEQHLAQVPVRGDVAGLGRNHFPVGGDRGIGEALLLEQDTEVEMRSDEIGPKGQRALVRALGFGSTAHDRMLSSILVKEVMAENVVTTTPEAQRTISAFVALVTGEKPEAAKTSPVAKPSR